MQKALNIYISATRQNDGKTTTSLGLFNAFSDFFNNVGYMKPVGQRVDYFEGTPIDKDVKLMNDVYHISGSLNEMSPVAIPKGYTEDFILHGDVTVNESKILSAYENATRDKEIMVIEGTGHAGVGSVIGLSNARVAKLLGASVIIITCGGIGRPIDEVMLNMALFDQSGVDVIGVVVNKVMPEKIEKISKFVRMGFESKGLPVLGIIPYFPMLSSPTILQVCDECGGSLLCGEEFMDETVSNVIVGAMPPNTAIDYFKGQVMLITPGNRDDLLLAALACSAREIRTEYCVKGIVLTGGIKPHPTILYLLSRAKIPVVLVEEDTFSTAKRITNMIVKLNPGAKDKIEKVKEIVKEYVDINTILERVCENGEKN
ncbi:MAG: phosphotransacetylase family protein [Spirochaetota bacterium]